MRSTKWPVVVVALIVVLSCFFPWIVIESKQIVVSGVQGEGTNFGKPGYFTLILLPILLFFFFLRRLWAHRAALFLAALNIGWTIRTFLLLSICEAGECPERQPALFIYLAANVVLLVTLLVQKVELPHKPGEEIPR